MFVVRDSLNHGERLLQQKINLETAYGNVNVEQRERCIEKLKILEKIGEHQNESIIRIVDKFKLHLGLAPHLYFITQYYEVNICFFLL